MLTTDYLNSMQVNGLTIEVERKLIKHIHLAVYPPNGRVHMSAPLEYTEEQLRLFALSHWMWICEKREENTSYNIQPKREYVSGEAHYYKGSLYRLKVLIANDRKVRIVGDYIEVTVRKPEKTEEALYGWYRERLEETLSCLMEKWEEKIGVRVKSWEVRAMPRRWGSTSKSKEKVIFNTELAKKPISCIEYIVVHELIHLIERIHTDRFYSLLTTFMPDWENRKEMLNKLPV